MYVVAGRIVEQVTGESWESFVQARILSSLKMRRTVLSAEEMATDSDHASPMLCTRERTKNTDAETIECHRARRSRKLERTGSRPLAHISRDEITGSSQGGPLA